MTTITLRDVSFKYGRRHSWVLKEMNGTFSSHNGSILAVMGPSGSGKTTLLRILAGVVTPRSGVVAWEPEHAVSSYVPQEGVLFEHLSRTDNARYFERVARLRDRFDEQVYTHVLDRLRLRRVVESRERVEYLSGGEKQRLSLLRALSIRPEVLLLDEPCNGLDSVVKYEFLTSLRSVTNDLGLLVVYVTHHADEVQFVADEVFYLEPASHDIDPSAYHLPLDRCLDEPPTLHAAQLLYDPMVAVFPGVIADGVLRLQDCLDVEVTADREVPFRGRCFAAVPAATLRLDPRGKLEMQVVGNPERSHIARFPGVDGSSVVYMPSPAKSGMARLQGTAYAFDEHGRQGIRVQLAPKTARGEDKKEPPS